MVVSCLPTSCLYILHELERIRRLVVVPGRAAVAFGLETMGGSCIGLKPFTSDAKALTHPCHCSLLIVRGG